MPAKSKPTDVVLQILKDAGVKLEGTALADVTAAINEQAFDSTDSGLGEGEIAVKEDVWKERASDLAKLRKRAHTAETRVTELESAMEAGESPLKKENELLRTKLKDIEPLHSSLLEGKRSEWKEISEKIPENLQAHLHWPKNEKETLSDAQVIENMKTIGTWQKLGVPGAPGVEADGGGEPKPPSAPRPSPTGKTQQGDGDLSNLTGPQKMEKGYKPMTTPSSGK